MQRWSSTAVFWLPDSPDTTSAGTLVFDPDSGVSAELIGSLDPEEPIAVVSEIPEDRKAEQLAKDPNNRDDAAESTTSMPIVLGVAPGHEVTLVGVRRAGGPATMPGPEQERLWATHLLRGGLLTEGLETPVVRVSAAFDVLTDWYRAWLLRGRWPGKITRDEDGRLEAIWISPETLEAPVAGQETIVLGPRTSSHDSVTELGIKLRPEFTIRYNEPRPLGDAFATLQSLRWFLSLVTRAAARIVDVHVVGSDDPLRPFDVFYAMPEPSQPYTEVHPYTMALQIEDIDYATVMPRWFDVCDRYRVPITLCFANWFSSGLYAENRLLNAAAAAESFGNLHYGSDRTDLNDRPEAVRDFVAAFPEDERPLLRERLKHVNEPSLRQDLRRLAAEAAEAFRVVVKDSEKWIGLVVDARNDIAHGARLAKSGVRLRALAETAEHLVEAHLLMKLGFNSSDIERRLRDTPRTRWIAQLAEVHLGV